MGFAKKAVVKFTSWSYTRYSDWKRCPLSAKLKHLDKISEPPSPAMARGAALHTDAEHYIKGLSAKLNPELAKFKDEFKRLRTLYKSKKLPMIVEDNWAFTREWTQTQWNNWAECVVRIKLDAAHYITDTEMVVTDWKSGQARPQEKEAYMEQLSLYALAALLLHPHLERVQVRLAFTDAGIMYPEDAPCVYTRADLKGLRATWDKNVKPMLSATSFPPKPNDKCRWCFYGQSGKANKGGPGLCKF